MITACLFNPTIAAYLVLYLTKEMGLMIFGHPLQLSVLRYICTRPHCLTSASININIPESMQCVKIFMHWLSFGVQ